MNTYTQSSQMPEQTRIPISDSMIVSVMAEGKIVHPAIGRLKPLVEALDCASPDLAIAMWIRFRRIVSEATQNMHKEYAALTKLADQVGVVLEPTLLDSVIGTLPTNSMILHNIGQYRAYAYLVNAFATAQAVERVPTAIMKEVLASVIHYHAQLLDQLNVMIKAELATFTASTGEPLPAGDTTVCLSLDASDPSCIVVEH